MIVSPHAYLFLIKYGPDGPWLDDCLDLSCVASVGVNNALTAEKVAVRLGADPDLTIATLGRAMECVLLRARLDGACDGPYLLHTEGPLTRGDLEAVLRDPVLLKRIRDGGQAHMNHGCMDTKLLDSVRAGTTLFVAYKLRTHYRHEVELKGQPAVAAHLNQLGVPVDVAIWLLTSRPGDPPVAWVPHLPENIEIVPVRY